MSTLRKSARVVASMVFGIAVCVAPAVRAQTDAAASRADGGFSARVGVGRIASNDTAQYVRRHNLALGVSYDLSTSSEKSRGRIDVDAFRAARRLAFQGVGITEISNRTEAMGLSYVRLFHPVRDQRAYVGLGLGVYRVRSESSFSFDFDSSIETTRFSKSATRIGAKALVGYNFNERFFGEMSFSKIGKVQDLDPGHFAWSLGARF